MISSPAHDWAGKFGPVLTGPGAVLMRSGFTWWPLLCNTSNSPAQTSYALSRQRPMLLSQVTRYCGGPASAGLSGTAFTLPEQAHAPRLAANNDAVVTNGAATAFN
jgi:hypothetical protein